MERDPGESSSSEWIRGPAPGTGPYFPSYDVMQLNLSWLRSFLAVADCRGFGAATIKLHLSQSRVSSHIAALEHALRVELFARNSRPTTLTTTGHVFRAYVEQAFLQLQEGVDAARGVVGQPSRLMIGSYPSVSSAFLPAVLSLMRSEQPLIGLDFIEGTASSLAAALIAGSVDAAFRPLQPRIHDPSLVSKPLWRERIVAVMRSNDPLASLMKIPVSDLAARPLIGNPSGSEEDGGGFDLRHALGTVAKSAEVVYLTDQPTTLVALVRSAFGIGVVAELTLKTTSTHGLVIREIDSPSAFRDVALFWSRTKEGDAAIGSLLAAVSTAELPAGMLPPLDQAAIHSMPRTSAPEAPVALSDG